MGDKISYILDGGDCENGIESTIIGFENNQPILYRVGAISKETIELAIGTIGERTTSRATPEAPGMLSKHYSPKTKFVVTNDVNFELEKYKGKKIGLLLFDFESNEKNNTVIFLSKNKDFNEAAHNLYAAMHQLDALNLDVIIAQQLPAFDLGNSINDRLFRAQETNFEFKL